jgi:hypothetical protein
MHDRLEEINREMLREFKKHGVEDTTQNRISFLTGLKDGWMEEPVEDEYRLEKTMYELTIVIEIARLRFSTLINR